MIKERKKKKRKWDINVEYALMNLILDMSEHFSSLFFLNRTIWILRWKFCFKMTNYCNLIILNDDEKQRNRECARRDPSLYICCMCKHYRQFGCSLTVSLSLSFSLWRTRCFSTRLWCDWLLIHCPISPSTFNGILVESIQIFSCSFAARIKKRLFTYVSHLPWSISWFVPQFSFYLDTFK